MYYGDNKVSYHYGTDDNGRKGQLLARHTDFMNEGKTTTHHHYGPYGLPALSSTTNSMNHISYDVSYHYKPRGELITQTTQLKEDNNPATSTTIHYQYDAMNRLIDEQHEQQKQTRKHIHYRYDGNNNLLEKTHKTPTEQQHLTYRYNVLDQLVSIETDGKNNRTPIIHDTNGRLLQDSQGARYEYDDIDLLTRVTPMHGSVINYRYLPNGLLAERLSGSQHSDYYYDPQKRIITAFNDHHWRSFIREGRTITAAVGEQGIDQLYKANQSTGVVVTQGKAQESHYEGYGKRTDTNTSTNSNTATHIAKHTTKDTINDFGWNQELTDDAVHLTYLRNRFYNIDTQRFITRDHYPVDNRYAYAKGNPITNIDPTGHNAQQAMNYGLGGGFTALGIIGAIFAVPTGGASLTLSAAAGVGAGVTGALSGISLMGSQAALDSGNKAAAKALQYTSIVLGALSAVEGVVAIAPKVAEYVAEMGARFPRTASFLSNTEGASAFKPSSIRLIDENLQAMTGEEDMSPWGPRLDNVKADMNRSTQFMVDGMDLKAYLAEHPNTDFSELNITNEFFNTHQVHQGLFVGLIRDYIESNPGRILHNVVEPGASMALEINGNAARLGVTWQQFDYELEVESARFYAVLHVVYDRVKNSQIWYFENPLDMF